MRELREISFLMNEDKFDGAHVFEGPHNAVRGSPVKAHFPGETRPLCERQIIVQTAKSPCDLSTLSGRGAPSLPSLSRLLLLRREHGSAGLLEGSLRFG